MLRLSFSCLLFFAAIPYIGGLVIPGPPRNVKPTGSRSNDATVLILGGGVAGIIAARTLHQQGIQSFLIIEARGELGGRLKSHNFSGVTVEAGANWIHGTQYGDGPENPIFTLAKKWGVKTQFNDVSGASLSECTSSFLCRHNGPKCMISILII